MMKFITSLLICSSALVAADAPQRKLLFFTKSSGYEHAVISWKDGAPSFAEKELQKIPFFVRGKARRNTERYAAERGVPLITVETLYDAKAHYSR